MCGIAGFVQRRSSPAAPIERMTDRLKHRGPDGQGTWIGQNGDWVIALGHRRLSIIDIEGGRQPMGNETGKVQITYNGEVFNFLALRPALEEAGHRFQSRCDTEVILHHCEEHGPAGLSMLDGMFAFGLWDDATQTLLLARDRVGIKPLYYSPLPDGGIAFASELKALLDHPTVGRSLDPAGLASYFFADYAHPPHTLVRNVRKLEPGHYLLWSGGKLSAPQSYWSPQFDSLRLTLDEATNRLRSLLDQSVESQLVSDVPVGIFLSGGIDSSLVAALAHRHTTHRPLTFSIGFDDPEFDESNYARVVAREIDSEHIERRFTEEMLLQTLDDALDCLDEPMADPSILPTYLLSSVAAQYVKVVLGGDGGDELWAGYPTYKAHRYASFYQHIPRALRASIIEPIVARMPVREGYQTLDWKAKRFALRWDDLPAVRHLRWMSNTDLPDLAEALCGSKEHPDQLNAAGKMQTQADLLNQILLLDFQTYLPGSVLTKVDRASMAHGLEVRPPMLSNALIDFAFSLPSSLKLGGRTTKFLLKRAADGIIPSQVIHRKKKGFAIPLARWLRGPLRSRVERVIQISPLWDTGLLDRNTFRRWSEENHHYHTDRTKGLWGLIVLDHWCRTVC